MPIVHWEIAEENLAANSLSLQTGIFLSQVDKNSASSPVSHIHGDHWELKIWLQSPRQNPEVSLGSEVVHVGAERLREWWYKTLKTTGR